VAAGATGSVGGSFTLSSNTAGWNAYLIRIPAAAATTAALTGTATASITEADIVTGGKTIILTLTGDTFVASGATFDAQRQNIINGLDSNFAEAAGWDAVVKAGLAVTDVVRTSGTVVTVTLPAFASFNITAHEDITATIPSTALTGAVAIVATPKVVVNALLSQAMGFGVMRPNSGIPQSRQGAPWNQDTENQWQPTLSVHDPANILTLEDGGTTFTGTVAAAFKSLTASATGTHTASGATGTVVAAFKPLVASATGAERFTGTVGAAFKKLAASATGWHTITGTVGATLPKLTASATGAERFTGTGAAAFKPLVASATGTSFFTTTGTVAASFPRLTASAAVTVVSPITGTVAVTFGRLTASAVAIHNFYPQLPVFPGSWAERHTKAEWMQPTRYNPQQFKPPRYRRPW